MYLYLVMHQLHITPRTTNTSHLHYIRTPIAMSRLDITWDTVQIGYGLGQLGGGIVNVGMQDKNTFTYSRS